MNKLLKDAYFFISTFLGIWNLDFFRLVYTPFCLQPHTNTLDVLALDYLVAVYPLLLITLSYLLVLLYDRNVRLIVCLWKPFLPLFIKFRRQWNIRNSLVEVFATFFLLVYYHDNETINSILFLYNKKFKLKCIVNVHIVIREERAENLKFVHAERSYVRNFI